MDELPEEDAPGVPAWVVTFADLMSLLMCFFVLLLSFSEIDASKFKQIADELSKAFGVQRDVPALEVPMGTSAVFEHFSAAKPEPTVINEVRQQTSTDAPNLETNTSQAEQSAIASEQEQRVNAHFELLEKVLEDEISGGRVDLMKKDQRIVIRIEEKGSFPSGSAELTFAFEDLLYRMANVLSDVEGEFTIEGHTDDIPIHSSRYDSNWNLSADRAASVANVLIEAGSIEPSRFRVQGYAATRPRAENTTPENRALNRRVEIIIDLSDSHQETRVRLQDLIEQETDGPSAARDTKTSPEPPEITAPGRSDIYW